MKIWPYDSPGIPDQYFNKDKSPITAEEVRAIVIGKLRLAKNHILADIGSGTGAVAIEACRILGRGKVYAIEALPERAALIEKNRRKFELANLETVCGTAPDSLKDLPVVDRVFIGGSNGKLTEILQHLSAKLRPEGRVVVTAVTLETLNLAIQILSRPPFKDFEALAISVAELKRFNGFHLFQPRHSIHILAASFTAEVP